MIRSELVSTGLVSTGLVLPGHEIFELDFIIVLK